MDHGPWTFIKPPTWIITTIFMINDCEQQLITSRAIILLFKDEDYNVIE